jgi:hypothetical protein
MKNVQGYITEFSMLNDLLFAMSGECLDHLSYKSHPDSLHADVWRVVDFHIRGTLLNVLHVT